MSNLAENISYDAHANFERLYDEAIFAHNTLKPITVKWEMQQSLVEFERLHNCKAAPYKKEGYDAILIGSLLCQLEDPEHAKMLKQFNELLTLENDLVESDEENLPQIYNVVEQISDFQAVLIGIECGRIGKNLIQENEKFNTEYVKAVERTQQMVSSLHISVTACIDQLSVSGFVVNHVHVTPTFGQPLAEHEDAYVLAQTTKQPGAQLAAHDYKDSFRLTLPSVFIVVRANNDQLITIRLSDHKEPKGGELIHSDEGAPAGARHGKSDVSAVIMYNGQVKPSNWLNQISPDSAVMKNALRIDVDESMGVG